LGKQGPITLHVDVSDTGVGMAPDELDLIFDAFVQAQAGKNLSSGTGLGLTISRRLLELMGGSICVNSQLGQGSTFTFTLPVYPTSGTNTSSRHHNRMVVGLAPGQPSKRILVVDDQSENRILLVRLMTQLGLEVREAANGIEAVRLWQDWQPHLTWMDIRMPELDGYEATKQIRAVEQDPASIIIALTAQASQGDRAIALSSGCNDYISKPFQEDILFLKLQEYLGLEYRYADPETFLDEPPAPACPSIQNWLQPVAPTVTALLSLEWLEELEYAALRGYDRAILELVNQLPQDLEPLASDLMALADQYQFEQILEIAIALKQQASTAGSAEVN
jgi:two-component system, sensor histidine kinase and response regulator